MCDGCIETLAFSSRSELFYGKALLTRSCIMLTNGRDNEI